TPPPTPAIYTLSLHDALPILPMRHGLTLGELARWFARTLKLDAELEVVEMEGWTPARAPGFGWPLGERAWVNPSPNAPSLFMARSEEHTSELQSLRHLVCRLL